MAKFYSVGVGAGAGSYITLGALRAIEAADVIAVPVKKRGEKSTALGIIKKEFDTGKKEIAELEFPMSPDKRAREEARRNCAEKVVSYLKGGKSVAMITLGDVSIYSTCSYVHGAVRDAGFEIEIIPAVTAFCAAADKAGISLCEGDETVAVLPYVKADRLGKYIDEFDTVIIMKAQGSADELCDILKSRGLEKNAVAVSRVGMDGEIVEPPERGKDYGYFTTVIIKKNMRENM